jgi:hypothetical protein
MYRIEIRLHMNDVKLEIKGTKLDPPVNESRTSTVMGLWETPASQMLDFQERPFS